MWTYVKRFLHFGVLAALLMMGEVAMDLAQPSLMSAIVDEGVLGANNGGVSDLNVILTVGLAMVGAAVLGAVCGSANNVFANFCVQNIGNDLRKDVFSKIMRMSFSQIDRFGAGSLITRTTNDITQVERLVETFIRSVIRTGFTLVGSICFMFALSPAFGAVTLCVFPVALALMVACLRVATPLFGRLQTQLDQVNSIMQEDLGGIRTIKACVRETSEKLRFGEANAALVGTQLKALLIFALLNPAMNCVMYAVIAIIMLVGGWEAQSGQITPGTVMAAITYATQVLSSILFLVVLGQEVSRGQASWARVKAVLESQPELRDGRRTAPAAGSGAAVEFRDVTFAFPGAEAPALQGVSLRIEPGQTVAVMGSTGAGKTALVSLIARLYDATEGAVLVDGTDVRDYSLESLRAMVALAPQRTELFGQTIAQNIAWGNPDAGQQAVRDAARIAQADQFIGEAPEGYDALLGQRGMSLSGGQRQRVALARAVLKPAPVLVLDDATSALDLQTEARFLRQLAESRPSATVIMVAQRVATARHADAIVLLDDKRIAGVGTHDQLLAENALYQEIYASQFGEVSAHARA